VLVIGLTPAARAGGPDPPGFTLLGKNSDDRSFELLGHYGFFAFRGWCQKTSDAQMGTG
jgi:hypothetical protein